jgi:hypothetical protein
MKQFSLALHTYHDATKSFPARDGRFWGPNAAGVVGEMTLYNVAFVLMPYVEQQARYNAWLSETAAGGGLRGPSQDNTALSYVTRASFLACPSDGTASAANIPMASICVSVADHFNDVNQADNVDSRNRCAARSVFNRMVWMGMGGVSDGTSNTIAVSEQVATSTAGSLRIKGGAIRLSGGGNGVGFHEGIMACYNAKDPSSNSMMVGSANTQIRRGYYGFCGRAADTAFHTALPPNSPTCTNSGNGDSRDAWGVFSANSNHTGGVNGGMFDGSVQFISSTINWISPWVNASYVGDGGLGVAGNPDQKGRTGGPSDFGVWGALGSRDGGEINTSL